MWKNCNNAWLMLLISRVMDKQSPLIGYLGGKLMYQRDFFRFELQIPKDVEKASPKFFPQVVRKCQIFGLKKKKKSTKKRISILKSTKIN